MDVSTIASWGPEEDRPQRDQMRARLTGHSFMAMYRRTEGGKKQDKYGWWCDWVRKATPEELRWMWSSDRAFKDAYKEVYAQVAGDLILEETAKGNVFSDWWFKTDINERWGWLFEPACLQHDGWKLVERKDNEGRAIKTWTRPSK